MRVRRGTTDDVGVQGQVCQKLEGPPGAFESWGRCLGQFDLDNCLGQVFEACFRGKAFVANVRYKFSGLVLSVRKFAEQVSGLSFWDEISV